MAPSMTSGVTSFRSGFNRNRMPSLAPGIINEKQTRSTIIARSMGIMSFE